MSRIVARLVQWIDAAPTKEAQRRREARVVAGMVGTAVLLCLCVAVGGALIGGSA